MGLLDTVGSILGTNGAPQAISEQTAGAGQADSTLNSAYNTQQGIQAPYYQAGTSALAQMGNPAFQQSFNLSDFQQDPGYQFQMQQGQQAINRAAAAGGVSGGTLKSLQSYGQGLANQDYQQAYQNYNNNQNLQFSRLAQVAGMGQNAANAQTQSSENYGNNVSNTQMGLGNATAAATMGQSQLNSGMIGQAAGAVGAIFSDRRLKTKIKPVAKEELDELKATLTAFKFRYKHPDLHGRGDFIGVMAQDLRKSKLGRSLVFEDKDGNLQLEVHRVLMLFLATLAEA